MALLKLINKVIHHIPEKDIFTSFQPHNIPMSSFPAKGVGRFAKSLLQRRGYGGTDNIHPVVEIDPTKPMDWSIYTWGLNGVDNHENYFLRFVAMQYRFRESLFTNVVTATLSRTFSQGCSLCF